MWSDSIRCAIRAHTSCSALYNETWYNSLAVKFIAIILEIQDSNIYIYMKYIHWNGFFLLVPPFCFRDDRNLYQFQYKSPDNIQRPPATSDKLLWSTITFVLSRAVFFLGSADFPNCPKGFVAHLCWPHSAINRRCMEITITNQSGKHAKSWVFWSSLQPPHADQQSPKLEPSFLGSCDIRWWVQGQPLPIWWSCPRTICFLDATIHYPFNKTVTNSSRPTRVATKTMNSSINSTWDQCCCIQFRCLWVNMRRQWWWLGVSLWHQSGYDERYPVATKIFGLCGQRHGLQFVWSAPRWSWTMIENSFASRYGEGHSLLTWSSSIDTHIAPE